MWLFLCNFLLNGPPVLPLFKAATICRPMKAQLQTRRPGSIYSSHKVLCCQYSQLFKMQDKSHFVLSGKSLLLITSSKPQPCTGQLLFDVSTTRAPAGFAWLGSGRLAGPTAHHLPFAK